MDPIEPDTPTSAGTHTHTPIRWHRLQVTVVYVNDTAEIHNKRKPGDATPKPLPTFTLQLLVRNRNGVDVIQRKNLLVPVLGEKQDNNALNKDLNEKAAARHLLRLVAHGIRSPCGALPRMQSNADVLFCCKSLMTALSSK